MTTRHVPSLLSHLIESCRDGERGFALAAARVTDPGLKQLFTDLAAQRAAFAAELLPHLQRLGRGDARGGTTAARLHRQWIVVEQALRQGDHAIVVEVERGDRVTMQLYFDALAANLSPDTRDVVQRQCDAIEEGHARIPVRESLAG